MHVLRKIVFYVLLPGFLAATQAHAEEGVMLRFNGEAGLNLRSADAQLTGGAPLLYASAESDPAPQPFDRLLFNGRVSDSRLELQISTRTEGRWSEWQGLPLHLFPNGRFWARADLPRDARALRYRWLAPQAGAGYSLSIYAIEGIDSKQLASRQDGAASRKDAPLHYSMEDTIVKPPVVDRQQWGANPPVGAYIPHSPWRLTQHHTAGARVSTLAEGIQEMQFIQNFHQTGRGWQDIGYHFLVDDAGRIYEGVPSQYRGTHVGNNNTGNVGISYMGNLDLSGELPTAAAIESLKQIWSWLSFEYGATPDSLFGHRDYNATACPGGNLYIRLPELRNGVRERLGFGAPFVANPLPQPFSREVAGTAGISLQIRDAVEGVDINSIQLRVNGSTVSPVISGTPAAYTLLYTPSSPFPASQNVQVEVTALDMALPPDTLHYHYEFTIKIAALYVEAQSSSSLRNGTLALSGSWTVDQDDVALADLQNGVRLLAQDSDGSHVARIFPAVSEPGDYRIFIASASNFIGESARYRFVDELGREQVVFPEYNSLTFQQWGVVSPTPVTFDNDGDADGYIELSGLSGLPTRLMLDALRLEKVDRLDEPALPVLKSARLVDAASKRLQVAWYPNLEGDIAGYRLFASEDGRNWSSDPLVDESTLSADVQSYEYNYSGGSKAVYFRLVAVDTNRVEDPNGDPEALLSPLSDIYGVGLERMASILIVDNFDRRASWQARQHPFVRSYGEALLPNNHGFDSASETAVQNGEIDLADYDMVFYFCGDDSRADESLAAADQFRLRDYLEGGGKLFISGSEIGYDFAVSPASEQQRYNDLLKATYAGDLAGSNRVIGNFGTPFEGLDIRYGEVDNDENYIEDYPDYLQGANGGVNTLFYGNLRVAGVSYSGTYGGGSETAQMMYLGFPFETINTAAERQILMQRILIWFGQPTAIAGPDDNLPGSFVLEQNYPNPFNPVTNLEFRIPNAEKTSLVIYDIMGRRVTTLVAQPLAPGYHRYQWDGTAGDGRPVASGVYIYRLTAGEQTTSRKMILMK